MQQANIPQPSGLVAENGNPLSTEDFEKMRIENQTNVFLRHLGLIIVLGGAIGGLMGFALK